MASRFNLDPLGFAGYRRYLLATAFASLSLWIYEPALEWMVLRQTGASRADVLDGNPPQRYRRQRAYGSSKLANLLFGAELQRRATAHGSTLTSTMAHPGISATGLAVDPEGMGANPVVRLLAPWVMRAVFQSAASGARPVLYAATEAAPGSYTDPRWLRESRGPVGPARLSALAQDPGLASRLWQVSQDLSGVEYRW